MSLRERFMRFDDALAGHGVPPLTEWWREGVGRWLDAYEQRGVTELWGCAGRGSAKSTALYKLGLFFLLFGGFKVPAGERHYAVILSRLKEEAAKGVAIIAEWLSFLGIPHRVVGDVIELDGEPRGIRVVAASVSAASGWRAFFIGKDERSKLRMGGADDFDDSEIDASAAAMSATHADAPVIAFGSAWTAYGVFYDAITAGDDASRVVLGPAPTWVAAPHISEESTRRKERDPKKWAREYGSIFQGNSLAIDPAMTERLVRELHEYTESLASGVLVLDSSSGRGDAWSWAVAQYVLEPSAENPYQTREVRDARGALVMRDAIVYDDKTGYPLPNDRFHEPKPRLYLHSIGALEGHFAERLSFADAVATMCSVARAAGVDVLYGDQHNEYAIASEAQRHGCRFLSRSWNAQNKCDAAATLRRLIREGDLVVEATEQGEKLRAELLALEERVSPGTGAIQITSRRSKAGHGDRASLALMTSLLEAEGQIAGSPLRGGSGFQQWDPYDPSNR